MKSIPYSYCHCGCGGLAPIITKTDTRRGYVKGEPFLFIHGHHGRKSGVDYIEEDRGFITPCWIWQGATDSSGYGNKKVGNRALGAHRVYFERYVKAIPQGLHIDHLCRVRLCVNPEHLEVVTPRENHYRGSLTKLTNSQVRQLRSEWDDGNKDIAALAKKYRLSLSHTKNLVHRRFRINV